VKLGQADKRVAKLEWMETSSLQLAKHFLWRSWIMRSNLLFAPVQLSTNSCFLIKRLFPLLYTDAIYPRSERDERFGIDCILPVKFKVLGSHL
jgi:hypothetical protein